MLHNYLLLHFKHITLSYLQQTKNSLFSVLQSTSYKDDWYQVSTSSSLKNSNFFHHFPVSVFRFLIIPGKNISLWTKSAVSSALKYFCPLRPEHYQAQWRNFSKANLCIVCVYTAHAIFAFLSTFRPCWLSFTMWSSPGYYCIKLPHSCLSITSDSNLILKWTANLLA